MNLIFIIAFAFSILSFAQNNSLDYHSPKNKKLFADYLFCEGDYLRAVEEYEAIRDIFKNDTIDFKIMLCYSEIGLYSESNNSLSRINGSSPFKWAGLHLQLKNKLIVDPAGLGVFHDMPLPAEVSKRRRKLILTSNFFDEELILNKEDLLSAFENDEREAISYFYNLKINPPYKSPALAGIISAVVPGSGKMYVGEWGDGITALLVTGLFAFLAYDNFNANHNTRAWIFTGLGAFFYAGNIYGSVASAQIFNARINFEFEKGLNLFLEQKNYFMPDYDFCD